MLAGGCKRPARYSPLKSPEGMWLLLTPWFQPNEADFGFLASGTVREHIFVVLAIDLWKFVTASTQETNTKLKSKI